MTLAFAVRGQTVVQDTHGEAAHSAHIEVRAPDGTLATLYTGRTKAATVANPTTTDTFGQLAFYSDQAGVYTLNVTTPAGVFPRFVEAQVDAADLAFQSDIDETLAAAEAYTDAQLSGKTLKDDVRAATTANLTLSGLQTVDGVALAADDRVLVKDQTAGATNGIYLAKVGAWTRAADANTGAELLGAAVLVRAGGQALQLWAVTNDAPIVLGTTAVVWGQASGGSPAGVMLLSGDQVSTGVKQFDTVRPKKGPWADPIAWGADPTAAADSRAWLAAAQADSGNVRLAPGTYLVSSNLTLTGSWKFAKGAILKPASGVTITVEADLGAGRWQIFDLSLGGLVTWNSTQAKVERRVKVEWWGAVAGTGTSSATAAITAQAIQAALNVPSSPRDNSLVWFAPGACYVVDRQINIRQQATKLDAKGSRLAFNPLTWTGSVNDSVLVLGSFADNNLTAGQMIFASGWGAEQASTIAQHDNGDGSFSLDVTSTDLGEMDAITTVPIAVMAGSSYSGSADFVAISVATDLPDVGLAIVWLDSLGAELSRSPGTTQPCDATLRNAATVVATAPVGAVSANLELRVIGITNIGDSVRASNPVFGTSANLVPSFVDLDKLQVQIDGSNPPAKIMHSLVRNVAAQFLRWDWTRLIAGYSADYCLYPGDYNPVEMHILELNTGSALLDGVHHDGSIAIASPANASYIGKGKHQQHGRNAFWLKNVANTTIADVDISTCAGGAVKAELCGGLYMPNLYTERNGPSDTRPITLLDTLGVPTLQLLSTGKANAPDLAVTVQTGTAANSFKLNVLYRGAVKETYDNLVMDSASAFYAITKLARSAYVIATDLHSASAAPTNQPALIVAAQIDTSTLPNTTKIVELVSCNAFEITGRINAANGSGSASTHNYAGLHMTGCHGGRVAAVFKNAIEWDVYADDACTDIDVVDCVPGPLTTNAVPALKVRVPTSLETSRVVVSDTGMAGPAKQFNRPGALVNWITQPARLANWTAVGGSTIVGTATAPDGTGVVDVMRLPANTADSTVGRISTTAVIPGTSSAAMQVVLRFWARRNARAGYAYGEPLLKVQLNRGDGQRLLTASCPLGDQPHLFEFVLDTTKRLTYGLPTAPLVPVLPVSDTTFTVRMANAIRTDQVDVEVWGVQVAPAGTPYLIDPEMTTALSASAFGPVARGPRVQMFRGVIRREIWTPTSPQTAGLAPPLGDTQWRVGDIAWNSAFDAATLPLGWVCTVAGNPGTWVAFGSPTAVAHPTVRTITANDTLVLADDGQVIEANAAGAITLTVPPASSVAFPLNTEIEVYQQGAGQVTVTAGAGVTLRIPNGARTAQQYSTIGLRYRGSDIWVVSGDTTP